MKWWILSLVAVTALAADKPAGKKTDSPAAAARAKKEQPALLVLPAGAVAVAPGTYRYTDPQGKKWLYRETPFGLARLEDKPEGKDAEAAARKQEEAVRDATSAVEEGDYVHFTRPGPFGTYSWRRKKSELDETEKAVWERERDKGKANKDAQG
jgi:hypothetical protein